MNQRSQTQDCDIRSITERLFAFELEQIKHGEEVSPPLVWKSCARRLLRMKNCIARFIQLVHFLNTFKGKVSEIGCFKRFNRVIVLPFDIHITLTFDINLYDHLVFLTRTDGLTFSFR